MSNQYTRWVDVPMVMLTTLPPGGGIAAAYPVAPATAKSTLQFDGETAWDAPATPIVALPLDCVTDENVTRGLFPLTGEIRPDTMTYNTAASTTVIATMRMVAMTGDTAASSLRMTLFMVLSLLVLASRRRPRSRLDRAAIAPQQVERVARGSRQSDVVPGHPELVARVYGLLAADVGPVDPIGRRADRHAHKLSPRGRHGDRGSGRGANLQVHLVVRRRDTLRGAGDADRRIPRTLVHGRERHEGLVPADRRDQARHHDVQHRGQYHRNRDHEDGRNDGRHRSLILADDALHGLVLPGSFRRHDEDGGSFSLKRVALNVQL